MKMVDTSENSFMYNLFNEFRKLTKKYYYGNDKCMFTPAVIGQEQKECYDIMTRYRGQKSCFVQGMCTAVNQFIAHRYADSLTCSPSVEGANASKNMNIEQVYNSLDDFYDALWSFFCKYINGHNGSGVWTDDDWTEIGGNCLETDFKHFMFLNDFWYGFHYMCILSVIDWIEERNRNKNRDLQKTA